VAHRHVFDAVGAVVSAFHQPEGVARMTLRAIVVDINHADGSREVGGKFEDLIDFGAVYRAGWRGVIHKATEGVHFVDPLYHARKSLAQRAGLLWGAYHFMRPGDVGDQVNVFLNAVRRDDVPRVTRYVLDYEDEKLGLWQAEAWLELIYCATGQRPWLYGGGVLKDQLARRPSPKLGEYPLWLAEYGTVEKIPHPWEKAILWQRSGDGVGPGVHDVPGIGQKQDVDYFDGTDEELKIAWLDKGAATVGVA
jgi:lysozyme